MRLLFDNTLTLLCIFNLLQSIHYGDEIRLLAALRHLLVWNFDFWPLPTRWRLPLEVLFQSIKLHLALGHPPILWGALQESANNTLKFMNHFEIYEPYCLLAGLSTWVPKSRALSGTRRSRSTYSESVNRASIKLEHQF